MATNLIRLLLILLLTAFPVFNAGAGEPQDQFTFILPAPAIHQSLQSALPLPLEPDSSSFDGTLTIDSIDRLSIHDQIIALHGVVSGKNIAMNTEIAGRNIKLRLGQVTMPISCDLYLRFDQAGQQLFITPRFKTAENSSGKGEPLLSLLANLGNTEHPVDLKKLQELNLIIGNQNIEFPLEPVQITAKDNQLIIRLRPQKNKSN